MVIAVRWIRLKPFSLRCNNYLVNALKTTLYLPDDINECSGSPQPCMNGATCINSPPGSFTCGCAGGFTGDTCQSKALVLRNNSRGKVLASVLN